MIWAQWWYLVSGDHVHGPDLGDVTDISVLDEDEPVWRHAYKITDQAAFNLAVHSFREFGIEKVTAVSVTVHEDGSESVSFYEVDRVPGLVKRET